MIIDMHYHLEPRLESVDSLLEQMDRHDVDRVALMAAMNDPFHLSRVAVAFAAIGTSALRSPLRRLGLLMYRTTVSSSGQLSLLGKTYTIYDVPSNEDVASVMQRHSDRFYGWIFVNPRAADPLAEVERWAGQAGWLGVKTHPFWHRYPVAMLDDAAAYCEEKDWPLLIHLGADEQQGDYRYLPERHPSLKIVYAHAGVPFYQEVWDYARGKDNVYVDLSNPLYVGEQARLGAIKALGVEKCLHGTDGPYGRATQGRMLREILRLPLSDAEKERILGGNFAGIIGA